MFWVYILQGNFGRHYIGMTDDLSRRLAEHARGHTHTTKRLGGGLCLVARREFSMRVEAAAFERKLKSWKNPAKAVAALRAEPVESSSPDASGLVANSLHPAKIYLGRQKTQEIRTLQRSPDRAYGRANGCCQTHQRFLRIFAAIPALNDLWLRFRRAGYLRGWNCGGGPGSTPANSQPTTDPCPPFARVPTSSSIFW
jgi:predicted GIY-YIG superfamily endonuclease